MLKSRSGIFIFMLCIILLMMRAWYLPVRALTWDIFGYYLYLPAHFVHDDILLQEKEWQDSLMKDYRPSSTYYQLVPLENGNTVIKYSMGMAVALSPFYFIADGLASSTDHGQNGFSLPYQLILSLGGLVYAFFGLILLARLVKRYFDQRVVIWTLGIIFFGTNYLHLTAWDGTLLTHNILFTFYALLLLATDNWHKKPRWSQAFLVGLSLGMIALIRPSEAVAFFIPLLWGIGDKESFANKWKLITNKPKHILLLLITGLVTVLPQLLYWKAATGEFLFFSYTNAGEGMDLSNPHIKEFLFSFRKGWFVYTPLMFLALLGFWRIWKVKKTLFWPLLIFLVLDVYIASSWTTWWYAGGSFSSRSMVPAYTVMAFPIGYLIDYVLQKSTYMKAFVISVLSFLVLLNLFQTWQFQNGVISRERMTRNYYWAVFGRTTIPDGAEELLLVGRSLDEEEGDFDYSKYSERKIFDTRQFDSEGFVLSSGQSYSKGLDMSYDELTEKDHAWIVIRASIFLPDSTEEPEPLIVSTFSHEGDYYKYRTSEGGVDWKRGSWNTIEFKYMTPEVRTKEDRFSSYLWHRGADTLQVEYFQVSLFEPIDLN